MSTENQQRRPHLVPHDTRSTEGYTAKPAVIPAADVPPQPRGQHAQNLLTQFALLEEAQLQRVAEQKAAELQTAIGIQIEFESQQGVEFAAERLARDRQGIELMNVRERFD